MSYASAARARRASQRRLMERICQCGVGHPDPDDADYRRTKGDNDTVHGCDGCCHEDGA